MTEQNLSLKSFSNLPSVIINYNTQSSELLLDIRHFTETKKTISNIYYKKYSDLLPFEKDADKYWLVSDILLFVKKNKYSYYTLLNRKYNKYLSEQKSIHKLFNMFWAFLSQNDRNIFIQIRNTK